MFGIHTLRGKILTTFLGSLLLGMLITIILSTGAVISFSQNAADSTADTILAEELLNLDRLTNDKSLLIEEYFGQIFSEFTFLGSFANDLFNNRLNVTSLTSYYAIPSFGGDTPEMIRDEINNRDISLDASGWYVPGLTDESQASVEIL
ncbi:MAG: hypothetical protein IH840_10810, partial [Candidatus Heimdallarchaeota archaeon]|nr:hypothetical protein [Candidatus Heimdallarchaeota archaeon]